MAWRLMQAVTLVTLAACGMAQGTSPPPPAPSSEGWQLSFQISGGFAGLDRRLELTSTGVLTAQDRRRGTDVSARTPPTDLTRITALIADLKAIEPAGRTTCRDCLEYVVEIQTRGRPLVFHLQDTTLSNSGLEPLMTILTRLLDDAVSGRLTALQPAPG